MSFGGRRAKRADPGLGFGGDAAVMDSSQSWALGAVRADEDKGGR